jgi:hypothetical protein
VQFNVQKIDGFTRFSAPNARKRSASAFFGAGERVRRQAKVLYQQASCADI